MHHKFYLSPKTSPQSDTIIIIIMDTQEHLTHAGPKRLHILYVYIVAKFNAYNRNLHTHAHARTHARTHVCTHTHTHTHAHAHTHTHTHRVIYQSNGTEEKVLKKRMIFEEDYNEQPTCHVSHGSLSQTLGDGTAIVSSLPVTIPALRGAHVCNTTHGT